MAHPGVEARFRSVAEIRLERQLRAPRRHAAGLRRMAERLVGRAPSSPSTTLRQVAAPPGRDGGRACRHRECRPSRTSRRDSERFASSARRRANRRRRASVADDRRRTGNDGALQGKGVRFSNKHHSDPQAARHELSPDRIKDLNCLLEGEIEVLAQRLEDADVVGHRGAAHVEHAADLGLRQLQARRARCRESCMAVITCMLTPVAPTGWPLALSPPETLTGSLPSRSTQPSWMARSPSPGAVRPIASYSISSAEVKQSWLSTNERSSRSSLASASARFQASCRALELDDVALAHRQEVVDVLRRRGRRSPASCRAPCRRRPAPRRRRRRSPASSRCASAGRRRTGSCPTALRQNS